MNNIAGEIMENLPPEYAGDLLGTIRDKFLKTGKTLVVLDDDPTGTQTCHDVIVLTTWRIAIIAEELKKKPSILFILTNSRSLPRQAAIALAHEIGDNLQAAARDSGRDISIVSRSDSTLRGHFPAEVDAVASTLALKEAVRILVPAFIEGGRFTINDVHYVRENNQLVPVAETPFAKDTAFGYSRSNLREWVEEKTDGLIKSHEVASISLHDIRVGGPEKVSEILIHCHPAQVCIANACTFSDLEVVVMGLLLAEESGKRFLYRTSATFVPIRAGIAPGKFFHPTDYGRSTTNGSLVIVGSYVPKTTRQLSRLLRAGQHHPIEIDVRELLNENDTSEFCLNVIEQIESKISEGKNVVIYTSRQLETGKDAASSLQINSTVSSFLVKAISGLSVRPELIVAKGGITSSDVATKGLGAEKAMILGQIIAGVPVWRLDSKSKFPDLLYVVFPGNVGDDAALVEVCNRFDSRE